MYNFIEFEAEVRYWEDATVNGETDNSGNLIPLRRGPLWCGVINLETGQLDNWPSGVTASVHYKVCDAGEYWLLNANRVRVAKWKDYYVPNRFLCVGHDGYGDYIIFKVDETGKIINWKTPSVNLDAWEKI